MLSNLIYVTALATTNVPYTNDKQISCLAENIYHEAGNQPKDGKIAVTNVVFNRINSGKYPKTPCDVIKQRSKYGCQFSWVCSKRRIRDYNLYKSSIKIAEDVYHKRVGDITNGALFFRIGSYHPKLTVRIGPHIFYR